jgi:hypothetical protein
VLKKRSSEGEKTALAPIKQKIETAINNLSVNPNLRVLSKYHWFLNKIIDREQVNFIRSHLDSHCEPYHK